MLDEMRIRALGVIEDATLELDPGLTVLTGETGAGKTMVVTGLSLLLGGRADSTMVRHKQRAACVEGRLHVDAAGPAAARALDAGAELDADDTLIVARTVLAEGRSRAHLGGRSVPITVLAELADDLVAVHGQSDQLGLLRPAAQRAALDRYAGPAHAALLDALAASYHRWRAVDADLADRTGRIRERRQEADLLRHGIVEIDAVQAAPGEDDALSAESRRLAGADDLRIAAQTAHDALAGREDETVDRAATADVSGLVGLARRALEHAASGDVADPDLAEYADRLADVAAIVRDVTGDLASYVSTLDADPARLHAVESRRAELKAVTRKYADGVDGMLAWAADARDRLVGLDTSEEALAALRNERDTLAAETDTLAGKVSRSRVRAGRTFAAAVTDELAALAMADAELRVAVRRRATTGPEGYDDVALELVAHRGAEPRAVQRGASGGELSRIMLAIEVVLAGHDPVPTMVFDEVDAGVGGSAATEVGRRLARLARDHQVIVVTHLPQVAAYADRHLVVDRTGGGRAAATRTAVRRLDDAERTRELARMLAGLADSELGQAHAEELLDAASRDKSDRSVTRL
ncbi:MAG: DNA repair protein RecN [Mycobacteriales bacterium]